MNDKEVRQRFERRVIAKDIDFVDGTSHPFMGEQVDRCDRCGDPLEDDSIYRIAARLLDDGIGPIVLMECATCFALPIEERSINHRVEKFDGGVRVKVAA